MQFLKGFCALFPHRNSCISIFYYQFYRSTNRHEQDDAVANWWSPDDAWPFQSTEPGHDRHTQKGQEGCDILPGTEPESQWTAQRTAN